MWYFLKFCMYFVNFAESTIHLNFEICTSSNSDDSHVYNSLDVITLFGMHHDICKLIDQWKMKFMVLATKKRTSFCCFFRCSEFWSNETLLDATTHFYVGKRNEASSDGNHIDQIRQFPAE